MSSLMDMLQSYHGGSYAAEQRKLLQEKLLQEKLLQQVDGPSLREALPVSVANERPSPTVNTINTIDPSAELRRQADIVGGRFKAPFPPHDSTVAKLTPDWTQNREAYLAYLKAKEGKRATAEIDQTSTFSPEVLAEVRARTGAQKGIPGPHEGFPANALVPKFMPQEEKEKLTSDPANSSVETKENAPSLWETWGSLADNPKERKKAYLSSIKNIYMKKMLLDSIAKLTGGTSQGDTWARMAIAELDAMDKFDSEQRLHNQWKALFFREDGTYDPPKNRKEAMKRGHQLGYDADQMKDIMSVFPKETDDRPALQKNISFVLAMEDSPMKRSLMKKHGLIETDDLTAAERSADRAVRDGIITEKEREAYVRSIFVPKDTPKTKGGVTTEQFDIWKKKTNKAVTPQEKADALTYGIMVRAVDRENPDTNGAIRILENIYKGVIIDENGELAKYANSVLQKQANLSPTTNKKPVTVSTQAEYDALASGTLYIDGSGEQKRKP